MRAKINIAHRIPNESPLALIAIRCRVSICWKSTIPRGGGADPAELQRVQQTLIDTLPFGTAAAAGDITKGPTITRYEAGPAKGVRVDKIVSLSAIWPGRPAPSESIPRAHSR